MILSSDPKTPVKKSRIKLQAIKMWRLYSIALGAIVVPPYLGYCKLFQVLTVIRIMLQQSILGSKELPLVTTRRKSSPLLGRLTVPPELNFSIVTLSVYQTVQSQFPTEFFQFSLFGRPPRENPVICVAKRIISFSKYLIS